MPTLSVKNLPPNDAGRLLVRLNHKYREGIPRYGIAKIKNSKNDLSVLTLVLGIDDDSSIFMPFDIRHKLRVNKGAELEFQVEKARIIGKLCWYLRSPDPAIHLPGWLAIISVTLAIIGAILTLSV